MAKNNALRSRREDGADERDWSDIKSYFGGELVELKGRGGVFSLRLKGSNVTANLSILL